jgi:hypothetical protein
VEVLDIVSVGRALEDVEATDVERKDDELSFTETGGGVVCDVTTEEGD